jgi:uncharacterized protein
MIFVADAGPIISFGRVGRLELLRQVVATVWIPEAVYQELVTRGAGRPGAEEVSRGAWIQRKPITQQATVRTFPRTLGAGEREAIMLAHELGAVLQATRVVQKIAWIVSLPESPLRCRVRFPRAG